MKIILQAILICVMLVITIQDLKYRAIHYFTLIIVTSINLLLWYIYSKSAELLMFNLGFLLLTFIGLGLYHLMTKRNVDKDLILGLGLGDILFFIAVIPLFNTTNYILFFISGLVFSIILHLLLKKKLKSSFIPLAGYLSIYLVILNFYFFFSENDFYSDLL